LNTLHCQLIAKESDMFGYITYIFKNLEPTSFLNQYIMCTRFKNWQHGEVNLRDIGYLTFKEVVAGKDTWYDKETGREIPYNYSNLIFIKFIPENNLDNSKEIIL